MQTFNSFNELATSASCNGTHNNAVFNATGLLDAFDHYITAKNTGGFTSVARAAHDLASAIEAKYGELTVYTLYAAVKQVNNDLLKEQVRSGRGNEMEKHIKPQHFCKATWDKVVEDIICHINN